MSDPVVAYSILATIIALILAAIFYLKSKLKDGGEFNKTYHAPRQLVCIVYFLIFRVRNSECDRVRVGHCWCRAL